LLDHTNARCTVARSIAPTRAKVVRQVIKDAKTQLPDDGPGAVFIEIAGPGPAARQLEAVLGRAAHRAVVWATVWKGGAPVEVVWQNEQPFDARLTT
jgi:hypothetical protein